MRSLGLPLCSELSVEELCERLSALRRRPMHVLPMRLPSGPHGLLVSTGAGDYIVVEEQLVPIHQRQVILHEVGHVVCGHEASPAVPVEASRLLFPSLASESVHRVLRRDHSESDEEIEAEFVASLIGRRISTWSAQRTWTVPPEARDIAERLSSLEAPSARRRT
ncbi:hypothetical protein AB0P32_31225 [Streptomyces sp. NPDC085995]|uniref:ImmA/IrrE family metallo-endopeptidase n=1 Tax=Streptomyces sp. NPDC085995 TaxID=3154861 RepID=UPI0034220CB1